MNFNHRVKMGNYRITVVWVNLSHVNEVTFVKNNSSFNSL